MNTTRILGLAAMLAMAIGAGAAQAAITANAITANALTANALTNNALTAGGEALDQLNGVMVEAVTLPVAR